MSSHRTTGENRAEGLVRPIDWGRGPVPRIIVTAAMLVILMSNTFALFISVPYVVRGLPDRYGSYVSGAVQLPFVPLNGSGLTVSHTGDVSAYEPFEVMIEYADGLVPYGMQELSFGSIANRYMMSLHQVGPRSKWTGAVSVPGLPGAGVWNMTLIGLDRPDGIEMYRVDLGNITVSDPDPGELDVMPALSNDRSVGPSIELRVGGKFAAGTRSIVYRIDGGAWNSVPYRKGVEVPVLGLDQGWHLLTIRMDNDTTAAHPFRIGASADHPKEAPDVTIRSVFGGRDEAYDQDTAGAIRIISGDERAVSGSFYFLTMVYSSDPRGKVSEAAAGYMALIPSPPQGVNISGRIYPAWPLPDGRSFEATVLMDPDRANGSRLAVQAGPLVPRTVCRIREFTLTLIGGRTPSIVLGIDPFLPRHANGYPDPLEVRISDKGYDIGRKTFDRPPIILVGGSPVRGVESHPLGYWTTWSYDLGPAVGVSGDVLEINSSATFHYRDNLFLLLPIPPFLFGFETPIIGVVAVMWFLFLLACISSSIAFLFRQEVRRAGNGSEPISYIAGPGSPLYLTALAYSGILFFSVAAVITFNLMDQSTPAPGILSESTPVHFRMMMLAEASVWEEIVARIGYIGVPLFVIGMMRGRKVIAGGLLGGTGKMGLLETALILVSASLFGIAHIGWGPWKVLPTFVSGLLLGYLFVRVGVHASIAVHFLIDYSSFLWEVSPFAAQFYWIFSIVLLVLLVMGALSMGILVNKALMRSSGASFRGRALWATAAVHSFGAVIFALLIGPGQILIFTTMLCLPLAYIAWYAFKKGGLPTVGRAILLFMSVTTLVLAPLGVAFVMADADGEMSQ